jgi:hypothetical protein
MIKMAVLDYVLDEPEQLVSGMFVTSKLVLHA